MKKSGLPKWKQGLTASERRHIKDTTSSGTLTQFRANRKAHLSDVAEGKEDPCLECRIIARKLGLTELIGVANA
jgi:hypothetical protein